MIGGHWEGDHYVPEPSMAAFEQILAEFCAALPCSACGKPLGLTGGVIHFHGQKYHPVCWAARNMKCKGAVPTLAQPLAQSDGWELPSRPLVGS